MDFKPFKIGRFLLLDRLATGGMAEVYRAKASGAGGFEKQLAVKRILPTYSGNEEFIRMFEYEARLSSQLTHSNIVQVYDFVKVGDTYLLAMEFVDGKNLRQMVNKLKKGAGILPLEFSVYMIKETCQGLEYAHKKRDDLSGKFLNIIHRDMSPQNIMLSYDGAVKIVDFGIAKARDRVEETRAGVIKGKFGYMSPEQANGDAIDHRSDVFSTAIILYELLTNKRLFAAENDMATLRRIQECVIPRPSQVNPQVTGDLEKILLKALTKDLTLRFQSAGSFFQALQEFLNKHYPSFTQKNAAEVIQKIFEVEINQEKKRFEQVYKQTIPFSQGASRKEEVDDLSVVEKVLDTDQTQSETGNETADTFVGAESIKIKEDKLSAREGSAPANESTDVQQISSDDISVSTLGQNSNSESSGTGSNALNGTGPGNTYDLNESPDELIPLRTEHTFSSISKGTYNEGTPVTGSGTSWKEQGQRNRSNIYNDGKSVSLEPSRLHKGDGRKKDRATINNLDPESDGLDSPPLTLDRTSHASSTSYPSRPDDTVYTGQGFLYRIVRGTLVLSLLVAGFGSAAILLKYSLDESSGPVLSKGVNWITGLFGWNEKKELPRETTSQEKSNADPFAEREPNNQWVVQNPCPVNIPSNPMNAKIIYGNRLLGRTPKTVSFECGQEINLVIELPGYKLYSTTFIPMKGELERIDPPQLVPKPTGALLISRIPPNTEILLDNVVIGISKLEGTEVVVPAGELINIRYRNELQKIDRFATYTVPIGQKVSVDFSESKERIPSSDR